MGFLTHLHVCCCISPCSCLGIPAHSSSRWPHRWYHLIDAFFGCRWRRSNGIMPWSKPPLSPLQFACHLQSHCAARTQAHCNHSRPWNHTKIPVHLHCETAQQNQKHMPGNNVRAIAKKLHNQTPCERCSDGLGVWQSHHLCKRAKEMSCHIGQTSQSKNQLRGHQYCNHGEAK